MWLTLPVFRNRRSTITTALTTHEIYIGTCITCFDYATIQRHNTVTSQPRTRCISSHAISLHQRTNLTNGVATNYSLTLLLLTTRRTCHDIWAVRCGTTV
jgi:hypothetical protein